MQTPPSKEGPRVNDAINVPEVRLIDESGDNVGVVSVRDAMEMAADAGLEAQRRDRRARRAAARAEVAALRCVERALKGVADEVIRTRTSFTEDQPRLAWRASPRKARRRRAPRLTDEATARLAVRGRNAVAAAGAAFSAAYRLDGAALEAFLAARDRAHGLAVREILDEAERRARAHRRTWTEAVAELVKARDRDAERSVQRRMEQIQRQLRARAPVAEVGEGHDAGAADAQHLAQQPVRRVHHLQRLAHHHIVEAALVEVGQAFVEVALNDIDAAVHAGGDVVQIQLQAVAAYIAGRGQVGQQGAIAAAQV